MHNHNYEKLVLTMTPANYPYYCKVMINMANKAKTPSQKQDTANRIFKHLCQFVKLTNNLHNNKLTPIIKDYFISKQLKFINNGSIHGYKYLYKDKNHPATLSSATEALNNINKKNEKQIL